MNFSPTAENKPTLVVYIAIAAAVAPDAGNFSWVREQCDVK